MAFVARELVLTYGTFVISTANNRLIDGPIRIIQGPNLSTAEFDFYITQSTEALFAAEVLAVTTAFRTPRKALTIAQGSETLYSFSHASNTGMNSRPEVIKAEDIGDTGRSRKYTVRIEFEMPADVHATSGRQDSTIEIQFSPARRRTVIFTGVYTALAGVAALAQYEANIDAYTSFVLSGLVPSGTYEKTSEDVQNDDQDKLATFRQEFTELFFNETISALDDAEIVRQELRVGRADNQPGDCFGAIPFSKDSGSQAEGSGVNVRRPIIFDVSYSAWIDKTLNTNLDSKYKGVIRPWLLQNITDLSEAAGGALMEERPEFDGPDNRISVTMRFIVPLSSVLERTCSVQSQDDFGKVLVPVWNGDGLARYVYNGPRRQIFTLTETKRILGTKIPLGAGGVGGGGGAGGGSLFGIGSRFQFGQRNLGGGGILGGGFGIQGRNFRAGVFFRRPNAAAGVGGQAGSIGGQNQGITQPSSFVVIDERLETRPLRLGVPGNQIDVTDITFTQVKQAINLVTAPDSGNGRATIAQEGF